MSNKEEAFGSMFGVCVVSGVESLFKMGVVVTSLKLKYPGIDPLMVVQVKTTEGPKIAFIGGANLDDIGKAFKQMVMTDSIKWKEDEWEMRRVKGELE